MSKKPTKIWLALSPDIDDLAVAICQDSTYTEVIALIREMDAQQQDWTFTRLLKALVDELMEEDPALKTDSNADNIKGI